MAHYAVIDQTGLVVDVFVGRDEDDLPEGIDDWETYYAPEGHTVKRTSYNTFGGVHYDRETGQPSADQSKAIRYNFAGVNYRYDSEADAFIPPQPRGMLSWRLNRQTYRWEPPVDMPDDGQDYVWDESVGEWVVSE